MMTPKEFQAKLLDAAHFFLRGKTDFEMAEAIGISQSYFSMLKSGKRLMSIETMLRICHATGLKPQFEMPNFEVHPPSNLRTTRNEKEILREAFQAGQSRAIGSHEHFEQTHPNFEVWYQNARGEARPHEQPKDKGSDITSK